MTLHVATARYAYRGPDRLDITRSGADRARRKGQPTPGEFLAPSDALLWPHKDAARRLENLCRDGIVRGTEAQDMWAELDESYREGYLAEMRTSYRVHRAAWDELLERERVVCCCFCRLPEHCHRVLAAGALVACGAVYEGEVPRG